MEKKVKKKILPAYRNLFVHVNPNIHNFLFDLNLDGVDICIG